MPDYCIRQAMVADTPVIARHRVGMFQDMGELTPDEAAVVESASRTRLVDQLGSGEYVGWLAESGGEVVAGAGVLLHQYYPTRSNPRGRPTAYILNVYTEPGHRRQGLAHQLMAEILAWCRAHDIPRASLHTSQFGRSIYKRLGFADTKHTVTAKLLERVAVSQNRPVEAVPVCESRLRRARVTHPVHAPRRKGRVEHLNVPLREKLFRSRAKTRLVEIDAGPTKGAERLVRTTEITSLVGQESVSVHTSLHPNRIGQPEVMKNLSQFRHEIGGTIP